MISHVTLGTNDLERAAAFYEAVLGVLGAQPMMRSERGAGFGRSMEEPLVMVTKPFDERDATVGNGTMIGLRCEDEAQARAVYEKAIEMGGTSEGEPGPRGDQGQFYGGYFRDLDGNKLAAFTMRAPKQAEA